MVQKWMFPMISFALMLLGSMVLDAEGAEEVSFLHLDFENDDGGLTHGGPGDAWGWGGPGYNSIDNPGPGAAGEGTRSWGCPLNGTYDEGTVFNLIYQKLNRFHKQSNAFTA